MSVAVHFHPHGTTYDNENGIASGHHDAELSPLGVEQARALGARFRRIPLAAVYCSDLTRARLTAALAFGGRGIPIIEDARLRECNYGELNGHPRADVDALRMLCINEPFPGGESYQDVVKRVTALLREAGEAHRGDTVMVIAHSAVLWSLEHLVNGVPLAEALRIPVVERLGARYEVWIRTQLPKA